MGNNDMTVAEYNNGIKARLVAILGKDLAKLAWSPRAAMAGRMYTLNGAPSVAAQDRAVHNMTRRIEFLQTGRDYSGGVYTLRGHLARR